MSEEQISFEEYLESLVIQGGSQGLSAREVLEKYSPDQERDDHGRFAGGSGDTSNSESKGGGSGVTVDSAKKVEGLVKEAASNYLHNAPSKDTTGDKAANRELLREASSWAISARQAASKGDSYGAEDAMRSVHDLLSQALSGDSSSASHPDNVDSGVSTAHAAVSALLGKM